MAIDVQSDGDTAVPEHRLYRLGRLAYTALGKVRYRQAEDGGE
jgi:hypothetical protein